MKTRLSFFIPITITALLLALLLAKPTAIPVQGQDAVGDLLGRINALRSSLGLPGYTLNGSLSAAAQSHAQWMATTGSVSHTGPDGSTPTTRAQAAGYPSSFVSENIYAGSIAGVNDAWVFWINSPIHYRGLTNPGYTEIGIGVASAAWGNAFVLDFGSQSNPYIGSSGGGGNNNTNGGGGGNAAAAPPSFIVGYDAVGNIMHEIQEEQTLGDIALIYGYTWADIPYLLQINGLTDEDVRKLQVGGVFLIPPHSGTYTPSPLPPGVTLTATAEPPTGTPGEATLTPTVDMTLVISMIQTQAPSATPAEPYSGSVVPPRIATAASAPDLPSDQPVNLPTQSIITAPTITLTPTPDASSIPGVQVAQIGTAAPSGGQVTLVREDSSKPLIVIAIVIQSLVILGAGYEFIRRMRR